MACDVRHKYRMSAWLERKGEEEEERAKRHLSIRARSSIGWSERAATYNCGLEAHKHSRPAPKMLGPALQARSQIRTSVPSPMNSSRSLLIDKVQRN